VTVDRAEIARYMRMGRVLPDGALEERVTDILGRAQKVIRPTKVWRRLDMAELGRHFDISGSIARHLDGCHAAYLACGTIGAAFDAFQRCESVTSGVNALIAQAVGAAMIERLMDITGDEIRNELSNGECLISRYSPGYGDFPLAAQRTLLEILDAPRTVGVSLTDMLLMVPSKSVSAIIGVRKDEQTVC